MEDVNVKLKRGVLIIEIARLLVMEKSPHPGLGSTDEVLSVSFLKIMKFLPYSGDWLA